MNDLPWLWWFARATGLVAEGALLGAMLCGLGVAGAMPFMERKRSMALHETWTLASLVLTTAHVVAIGLDTFADVAPVAIVVPFASSMLRGPVALGTFGLWGLGVVAATTVGKAHIPREAWRALHAVAYATFLLVVFHALFAGSDAKHPFVVAFHAIALASVVAASVWRAVAGPAGPTPARDGASG